ncbi:MAG: hypothetical protein LQ352_003860 [Teloschistes flavicans]|nr:MAG: hypothetical protein LQ352_003860 [Teloschistes flavicans]
MAGGEDETLEERLKAALWFSVGKIVDEETLKLGVNATPQFIGALTEMVWAQIGRQSRPRLATWDDTLTTDPENVSEDLRSFARHAGRQTISTEDVMLLARRNEDLALVLRSALDSNKINNVNATKRR